jgi:hypothetical protein
MRAIRGKAIEKTHKRQIARTRLKVAPIRPNGIAARISISAARMAVAACGVYSFGIASCDRVLWKLLKAVSLPTAEIANVIAVKARVNGNTSEAYDNVEAPIKPASAAARNQEAVAAAVFAVPCVIAAAVPIVVRIARLTLLPILPALIAAACVAGTGGGLRRGQKAIGYS